MQEYTGISQRRYKPICRRETARRFVSLNILLTQGHSMSFEMTLFAL